MTDRTIFKTVVGSAALALASCLSGCFSAPAANETGVRIGDETLKQFKAGVTSEAWLVAVLGEPTSKSPVADVPNTFVYRYATGESSSGLGAIFSGSSSHNSAVTYFIITDGVVTRYWADRALQYTLFGKEVEQPSGAKQEK